MNSFLATKTVAEVQELIDNPKKLDLIKAEVAPKEHRKGPKAKCALCNKNIYRGNISLQFQDSSFICINCISKYKFSKNGLYSEPLNKAISWADKHTIKDLKEYIDQEKNFNDISSDMDKLKEEMDEFKKHSIKYSHYYISVKQRRILIGKTFLTDPKFVEVDEIVSYQVNEKGHNEHKHHTIARATAGALIAGQAGAVLGGVTGGKDKEFIDYIGLIITLIDGSNFEVKFLRTKTKASSFIAKDAYSELQNLISIIGAWKAQPTVVVDQSVTEPEETATVPSQEETPNDIPAEIRKYNNLADDGIITQEEFAAKKKQLLGL